MQPSKPLISYEDFQKIDVRVGTITSAEKIEKSDKLIKLEVDFGEPVGKRTILTGMAKWHEPDHFIGRQTTFVINLEPRKMMGIESQGMVFALGLEDDSKPILLMPIEPVVNGEGAR